jgi:hypothetical protein
LDAVNLSDVIKAFESCLQHGSVARELVALDLKVSLPV